MRVYADNAATTRINPKALEAMNEASEIIYGNPSSMHEKGREAAGLLAKAREKISECLHCEPGEIVFTSGGSEADNQAMRSGAYWGKEKGNKHIISSSFEHHAILNSLKVLGEEGFETELLPVGTLGNISATEVERRIRKDTCLVSVMYVNNEIGSVLPIGEIGALCRSRGICFHTDAVQAAGHIPIDLSKINIDMMSLSAHKFHGPKGIGILYVRKTVPVKALIEGGGQERGRRSGSENLPAIIGMAVALEEACSYMKENAKKVEAMRNRLAWGLSKIPYSVLNGDPVNRHPGNVSFCFAGVSGEMLLSRLDQKGICASSGSACSAGKKGISHVLKAIGRPDTLAKGALRLTLDETNTPEEVDYLIREVTLAVNRIRYAAN